MKQSKVCRFLLALSLCMVCHISHAQVTNYKAYSIFLYSFSKYINWPSAYSQGSFTIAVMGKSKITEELQLMAGTKMINGRNITIRQVEQPQDLEDVHIVFVSEGRSASIDEVIAQVKGKAVLVVTERDGLVKKGAAISFITLEDNSLRFELNETNLHSHSLQASKSLQALAYKD